MARSPQLKFASALMLENDQAKLNGWVDETDKPENGPVSVTPMPNGNGVKVDDPIKTATQAYSNGSVAPKFVDPRVAALSRM